ncbi:MAG: DNA-binding response regulator [Xenococcus sp. (in: cyanobacteria)]
MSPEQVQEIIRLRALNLSPKQIARKLGLRPAEVNELLRQQAEGVAITRRAQGELALLERCLINEKASQRLLETKKKGWFGGKWGSEEAPDEVGGLAQIFVTRVEGNQYLVASYLVDYWCLGVKNVLGPRKLNRTKYEAMVKKTYSKFQQEYREITLEQAQAIIFGAVSYAQKLGLKPHRDFSKAEEHLGQPSENLLPIEFGRKGKPFYVSGPYDNSHKILAKLRETVGEGNFDYLMLG